MLLERVHYVLFTREWYEVVQSYWTTYSTSTVRGVQYSYRGLPYEYGSTGSAIFVWFAAKCASRVASSTAHSRTRRRTGVSARLIIAAAATSPSCPIDWSCSNFLFVWTRLTLVLISHRRSTKDIIDFTAPALGQPPRPLHREASRRHIV